MARTYSSSVGDCVPSLSTSRDVEEDAEKALGRAIELEKSNGECSLRERTPQLSPASRFFWPYAAAIFRARIRPLTRSKHPLRGNQRLLTYSDYQEIMNSEFRRLAQRMQSGGGFGSGGRGAPSGGMLTGAGLITLLIVGGFGLSQSLFNGT